MAKRLLTAAEAVRRARSVSTSILEPLRPVIVGPQAALRRYTVASERTDAVTYDKTQDVLVDWPELGDDEVVDLSYTKVYLENARLNYFNKLIGANGSCQASSTYPNRVRTANYVLKTANGSSRNAAFYDRDVAIGDIVKIKAVVSSVLTTHTSSVTGFVGEAVAASIGSSSEDVNNAATQGNSDASSQTAGLVNDVVITSVDSSTYDSLADGGINRTYTVEVIQGSTAGDATTAILRVTSSDGLDDVAALVPAAFGAPTDIGTQGLTATFDLDPGNSSVASEGYDEDDFVVGQTFEITVAQAFTEPVDASAGTYTGTADDTLIITVTRGGTIGVVSPPQITVNSVYGSDSSGPTNVTVSGAAVNIGNYGATISFTGTQMRAGDIYYVTVTAASEGAVKTLVLADDVPTDLQGIEVDIHLYIPQTGVELASTRSLPSVAYNWAAAVDGVTLEGGIYLTDATLTDGDDLVPVPLDSADVFIHYRAWVPAPSPQVIRVTSLTEATAAFGTSDPDNPLCWGVVRALLNTEAQLLGTSSISTDFLVDTVIGVVVGDPSDTDNWTVAFESLESVEDAYHIVPQSTDTAVHALAVAHMTAQSTSTLSNHRVVWLPAAVSNPLLMLDATVTSDEEAALATITQYPASNPAAYTLLTLTSGNANFITLGIRAGDTIRINFQTNAVAVETYDTYEVAEVVSGTSIRLSSGPVGALTPARRVEIYRTPTKAELVTQLTDAAADYADSRVRLVWPDTASYGGSTVPGFAVAAAIAGLASNVPSHQGLRNVGLEGVDTITRSEGYFTPSQLRTLGAGGVFVVSQDRDANIYIYSSVTTSTASVEEREEMVVRNTDMIRFQIMDTWADFFGIANVTDQVLRFLEAKLAQLEAELRSMSGVSTLGAPVRSMRLVSLGAVEGYPDQLAAEVEIFGPVSLNAIRLTVNMSVQA